MRSIVIYYSYSGNTKKLAKALSDLLAEKGEVEQIELLALDEPDSFFGQSKRALLRKRAQIGPVDYDLSKYDLICLGTPVWAFAPVPAMNTYLDRCFGLRDKSVVLFTTYGSGIGVKRCLDYMQRILKDQAAKNFSSFSIQQFKVDNQDFVLSQIKEKTRL